MQISYGVSYELLHDCITRIQTANLGVILFIVLLELIRLQTEHAKYFFSITFLVSLGVLPTLIPNVLFGTSLMGLLVTTVLFAFTFVTATFFEIKQLFKQQLAILEKRVTTFILER